MRFSEFVWSADDVITTDKYKEHVDTLTNSSYMKTDVLYCGKMMWRGEEHQVRDADVWVTGHSDHEVSNTLVKSYEGRFKRWFAVNMACTDARVTALPLGITNCTSESRLHSLYGDIGMMREAAARPRKNLVYIQLCGDTMYRGSSRYMVYMNFSRATFAGRAAIYEAFRGRSWVTVEEPQETKEGRAAYLAGLRGHGFSICPRGGGIDTHRIWESLYMGCIPIVQRERLVEEFARELPILVVAHWGVLTEEFLRAKYDEIHNGSWNMDALRISYWLAKIDAAVAGGSSVVTNV